MSLPTGPAQKQRRFLTKNCLRKACATAPPPKSDDADVKAYLAGRLAQTLAESDARRRGWDACARDLEALGAEHDALHEEKRGLVEAAREREASSDGANRERDAAHREALAAHVGELQARRGVNVTST